MLEIYLTRHGETQWNTIRKMQGQGNSPLTELGVKQAKWLGERLGKKEMTKIYSSPLGRAIETSKVINTFLNTEIEYDDRLMEIDIGCWQGREVADIEKEALEMYDCFWHKPEKFTHVGIESFEAVQSRGAEFMEEVLHKHKDGRILIVAHAIILKGILNYLQGRDIKHFWEGKHVLPTSLTKLKVTGDGLSIVYMSDISHYEQPITKGWFVNDDQE